MRYQVLSGVVALVAAALPVAAVQLPDRPLMLVGEFDNYVLPTYGADPVEPATHVYYVGEPIRIYVQIQNRGDEHRMLVVPRVDAIQVEDVNQATARSRSWRLTARPEAFARDLELGPPTAFALASHANLEWEGYLEGTALSEGQHELRVSTAVTAPGSTIFDMQTALFYEVRRPLRAGDAVEILARRASRALGEDRFDDAEQEVRALLAAHPRSFVAYIHLANLNERAKKRAAARSALENAINLLRQGADELYLEAPSRRLYVEQTIDALEGRLRLLR